MTSYINLFLKTEVTCIPKLLKNYVGDYYNNAFFNAATWVFIIWCVLHIVFDKLIDAFLKRLRYREYVRQRLKSSLWYLGFYGTMVVYSGATLAKHDVELFNFKRMHVPSSSNLPSQVVIGYTLISTFFLHSCLWEGLGKEHFLNMFSYLCLFLFLVSSYILRVVEISFTLTILTAIVQASVEFIRCCFMSTTQDSILCKLFVGLLYFVVFLICFSIYIIVIPLTFVIPLGLKILSDYPNMLLLFLYVNLFLWLIVEIYQSVLFKFVDHWFYHQEDAETDNFLQCSTGILECSLFKPRDDVSYNLQIIKKEIKARQAKMMSMRKPKNKSMLIQTLKCMAAIKRKFIEKRKSDSSDSESEKSEDSDKKKNKFKSSGEDSGEHVSDQDEETDDESQESVVENKKREPNMGLEENQGSDDEDLVEDSSIRTEKQIKIISGDEKLTPIKNLKLDNKSDNNNDDQNKDLEENQESDDEELVGGSSLRTEKQIKIISGDEKLTPIKNLKLDNKSDNNNDDQNKDLEENQESDDEELVEGSSLRTEKQIKIISGDEKLTPIKHFKLDNKSDNNNDDKFNDQLNIPEITNQGETAVHREGDTNIVQTITEESSKNKNTPTLLTQGDSNSKETIQATQTEDNANNNSLLPTDDRLLETTLEKADVEETTVHEKHEEINETNK